MMLKEQISPSRSTIVNKDALLAVFCPRPKRPFGLNASFSPILLVEVVESKPLGVNESFEDKDEPKRPLGIKLLLAVVDIKFE